MVKHSLSYRMRARKALSTGIAAFTLLLGVSAAQTTHAAGASLFIDQISPIAEYGHWKVLMPGDATFQSSLKTKVLNDLDAGSYTLSVTNPAGSTTKITLIHSGTAIKEVLGNSITFDALDGAAYRANIEFIYTGTVEVLSDPEGVSFEMKNVMDGSMYTGTTPAVFTGMAPVGYKVQYAVEPSCQVQKDLQRELIHGSKLVFWADFTCGNKRIPLAGRSPEPLATTPIEQPASRSNAHTDTPDKRIVQTASMSEVVPGGTIRYTITVKNITRETLHNVDVIDRYNPEMIDIVQPLFDGGIVNGNQIEWFVPKIFAGQSWTTTFTARAKDTLVAGDRIVLMAHAYSDESDADLYPEAWSSVTGVGIAYMPQTGDRYDVLLAIAALMGAALITNLTIRRKQTVVQTA